MSSKTCVTIRSVFLRYMHHDILVMRGNIKKSVFILSKEGVVQGDPLVMVGYGLLLLLLIKKLKDEFNSVDIPWYADDGSAAGSLENVGYFIKRQEEIEPVYRYFQEERNSILVAKGRDTVIGDIFKEKYNFNFQIKNGYHCLGGHIASGI